MASTVRPPLDRVQARDAENIRLVLQRMHAAEHDIAASLKKQVAKRGEKGVAALFHVHRDTVRNWIKRPDTFRVCHLAALLALSSSDSRP